MLINLKCCNLKNNEAIVMKIQLQFLIFKILQTLFDLKSCNLKNREGIVMKIKEIKKEQLGL